MQSTAGFRISLCSRCNAEFQPHTPRFPFSWDNLRSNYYPSSSEASRIYESMDDAKRELERYDEEINRARKSLEKLEEERGRLRKEMEGNQGLLSPVRRLPSEILQSIFTFLSESEGYSLAISKSGSVVHSPTFNLSRTSTYWRRIVHSTPDLWRSISIDVIGLDGKRRLVRLVNAYLENSGQSPLNIQITDDDFSPDDDQYIISVGNTGLDVFKALVMHSERWVKVDLRFRQDIFRMLETGSFQLPHLEELSMQSIQLTTTIRAACSKTSTLRTLKVDGFTYYGIAFPYHTLQDLVVGEIKSCQLFLRMLPLCNNLKSLRVDRFWATRDHGTLISASPSLPITCTFLERLSFTLTHWERLHMFFESLNFPALTEIEITLSYGFDKSVWPSEDFVGMLRRSRCSLRRLKLFFCPLSDSYLLDLFRLMPDLEEFALEEVSWMTCVTPHLLTSLTLAPEDGISSTALLPKLKRLSIHCMKAWDYSDVAEVVVTMLESRRDERLLQTRQCSRLDEVSLSLYPEDPIVGLNDPLHIHFGEEPLRRLGVLQDGGLRMGLTVE
ncbi:hypothetical protein V5O48_005026 [Marasmius crinis-equi]|uniref:F-box domain-containing protein n=1 Tax=Marasmius crinis-equi TaxID=585013 RepID=A0ABR3FNE6_9AGAR